jgi:Domain of unknown function (DUF3291)
MGDYHLAQVNVARMMYRADDERMKGFYAALDKVNALADRAEGFVWRLQDDLGDATTFRFAGAGADDLLINMSVWKNIDALRQYIYQSVHAKVMARRKQWFAPMGAPNLALWWIPVGTLPTLDEAQQALNALEEGGPTAKAFTFAAVFDVNGKAITLPPIQALCA